MQVTVTTGTSKETGRKFVFIRRFSGRVSVRRMRGVQAVRKAEPWHGRALPGHAGERVPMDQLVHGINWRDNVNYVRSFGYRDE